MAPAKVILPKDTFELLIPEGYKLNPAAIPGTRIRFLSRAPDGRLFVTDMYDLTDNNKGRILLLDKWNDLLHRFDTVIPYLKDLHNPNQVAFHNNYIYVAETHRLTRYPYNSGNAPSGPPEEIARFPDYGLSYKYGGWHLTRSLAFYNNKLYVSVGSSCNACIEKEEVRATVLEMNPDGSDQRVFARGLRNAVGIKWLGSRLYATEMGRDLLGPDKPEDLFVEVNEGEFHGWPFYFHYRKRIYEDLQFKDSVRAPWVKRPPKAITGFKAHSAPLGFDLLWNFNDAVLRNKVLVCLHGSTSIWRQRGYEIVMLEKNGKYKTVVSGFLTGKTEQDRNGRPCDVLMNNENSIFFTDDHKGVVYYLYK
ncbi:MAG: glucose/sorbosone dehydrogenase [Chitinophagaceae bacterium]|nr:MAG: glucose/sorbosone dehydrogenase [Chitinophagaceae bacterium]